jgi:hypothetical protein
MNRPAHYHRAFADDIDNSLTRSSESDYVSEGVDRGDYPDSSAQYTQRKHITIMRISKQRSAKCVFQDDATHQTMVIDGHA